MSRERIDKLIDIFLVDMTNKYKGDQAGWEAESMMAKLIDYQGDIPQFTGGDQSNLTMIVAIEGVPAIHYELKKIKAVIYQLLGEEKNASKVQSLLARHYYNGLNGATGHTYTDADRLKAIGFPLPFDDPERGKAIQRFRDRVNAGYKVLEAEILKYEYYLGAAYKYM